VDFIVSVTGIWDLTLTVAYGWTVGEMKSSLSGVAPAGTPEKLPVAVGGTEVPPLAARGGTWPTVGAVGAPDPGGAVAMAQQARRGGEGAGRKEKRAQGERRRLGI